MHFQEKRLAQEIAGIENDTGFKLRVLAQNYPDTPGEDQLFARLALFSSALQIIITSDTEK